MSESGTIVFVFGALGTALGLLGTVLGAISTWRSMMLDRAVLSVAVEKVVDPIAKQQHLQFSVVNKGRIPATLRNVGFTMRKTDKVFRFSPSQNSASLPRMINPGEIVSCILPVFVFGDPNWFLALRPFFEVAGGKIVKGKKIPREIIDAPLGYSLVRS
jgi:hypothetical protein